MAFFNRTDELAALRENWEAADARFFVLWGRRRVGKTELLTHFAGEGRRGLYFEATNGSQRDQLRDLSRELAWVSENSLFAEQPLTSWRAALTAIEQFVGEQRTLVMLDEFQYLAARDPALASEINRWWRERGRHLPIVLVLAGSEVGFFEREVLGGTMYGRRTGQLQLQPFDYRDAALFHPSYGAEDRVRTYAVCGGMPYYLARFGDDAPLSEHLRRHTLYRDGFLFEEAELLLRQELPDPRNSMSVLRAIAQGQTHNAQIAARTGLLAAQVSSLVATLERMQLVSVMRPVTASARTTKTSFAISDGFLNYYFRFIDPARSRLSRRSDADAYLEQVVLPALDAFVSKPAWEAICQRYVRDREHAARVGTWWGPVPTGEGRRTQQRELDVAALDADGAVVATGSCKWTNRPMSPTDLADLEHTEGAMPGSAAVRRRYLFSRSGFTTTLHETAQQRGDALVLLTPSDLYE